MNGIHSKEVDLLEFSQLNYHPSWYPIFGIPYTIQANIDYTPHTAVIKLVYIRSSQCCFSDFGLVFSRSDPILFADMATCDWFH